MEIRSSLQLQYGSHTLVPKIIFYSQKSTFYLLSINTKHDFIRIYLIAEINLQTLRQLMVFCALRNENAAIKITLKIDQFCSRSRSITTSHIVM